MNEDVKRALESLEAMALVTPREWDNAGMARVRLGNLRAYPHVLTMFEAIEILRAAVEEVPTEQEADR
jgi:hypothetical protein